MQLIKAKVFHIFSESNSIHWTLGKVSSRGRTDEDLSIETMIGIFYQNWISD